MDSQIVQLIDSYVGLLALIPFGFTFWEVWFGRRRRHPEVVRADREPTRPATRNLDCRHSRGQEDRRLVCDDLSQGEQSFAAVRTHARRGRSN
jgi:hypothetical protein